jgi:hypothetical protein
MTASRHIYYHLHCFKCVVCDKLLQKGDEFVMHGEGIFCKNDIGFINGGQPYQQPLKQKIKSSKSNGSNSSYTSNSSSSSNGPCDYPNNMNSSSTNGSSLLFSSSPSSSSSSVSSVSSLSSLSNYSSNMMPLGVNPGMDSVSHAHLLAMANGGHMQQQNGMGGQSNLSGHAMLHSMNSSSNNSKMNSINTNSNSSFTSLQSKRFDFVTTVKPSFIVPGYLNHKFMI